MSNEEDTTLDQMKDEYRRTHKDYSRVTDIQTPELRKLVDLINIVKTGAFLIVFIASAIATYYNIILTQQDLRAELAAYKELNQVNQQMCVKSRDSMAEEIAVANEKINRLRREVDRLQFTSDNHIKGTHNGNS